MKCASFADLSGSCSLLLIGKGLELSFSALGWNNLQCFGSESLVAECFRSWQHWKPTVIFVGFVLIYTIQIVLDRNLCLGVQIITIIFVIASLSFIRRVLLFFINRWIYSV